VPAAVTSVKLVPITTAMGPRCATIAAAITRVTRAAISGQVADER
jgi:hypothetical protein